MYLRSTVVWDVSYLVHVRGTTCLFLGLFIWSIVSNVGGSAGGEDCF